jgi:hypothetical protein
MLTNQKRIASLLQNKDYQEINKLVCKMEGLTNEEIEVISK